MRLGLRDDAVNESLERNEKRAQRRGFGIGLLLVGFHIRLPVGDEQIVGSDVEVILDRTRVRRQELGEVLKLDGHADAGLQIQGSDVRFLLETQHRYIQGDFGKGLRKRLDKRSNNGVRAISTRNRQQGDLIILPKETEILDTHNRVFRIHHCRWYFLILGIQTNDCQNTDKHARKEDIAKELGLISLRDSPILFLDYAELI